MKSLVTDTDFQQLMNFVNEKFGTNAKMVKNVTSLKKIPLCESEVEVID